MPRNPYRNTPIVFNNELSNHDQSDYEHDVAKITVGSAEWFTWLETASRFAYKVRVSQTLERVITLTLRQEVKQRGALYWIAYAKDRTGKLHKAYAGRSVALDSAHLETVGQLMIEKLHISYPTPQAASNKKSCIVEQHTKEARPNGSKQPKSAPLKRAELKPFRIFTHMLDFCSQEFERRWSRPWRWVDGKIARSHFDKSYYVWTKEGGEFEYLADQRYFIVTRLLHWVNHGYDTGYDHKLPNT